MTLNRPVGLAPAQLGAKLHANVPLQNLLPSGVRTRRFSPRGRMVTGPERLADPVRRLEEADPAGPARAKGIE
jgi:hypothetical protein